jgi:hypothetical protein
MKVMWILVAMLALGGCASRPTPVGGQTSHESKKTNLNRGEYMTASDLRRVRNPEFVKTYYMGRRPSKNGTRLHEAHRVYELEKSPRWNLLRNNPTLRSTGPVKALTDPAFRPLPESEQLQAETRRQEALTHELEATHEATLRQLDSLKSKVSEQSNHAVTIEKLQRELLRQRQSNAILQQRLHSNVKPSNDDPTDSPNRADALRQWGEDQGR